MTRLLMRETPLVAAALAALIAYAGEPWLLAQGKPLVLAATLLLVIAIVTASLRAAHHAEVLAEKVGDPYGTMILTLTAVMVEVVILAIMITNAPSPTLVRDTIYSAVMLDINGILGLAALMGGLKHGEQPYNDDSGKTYSVMILTAMSISMVVPEFIPHADWRIYSIFTIAAMILLYALFLCMQTGPHSYFFSYRYPHLKRRAPEQTQVGSIRTAVGGLVIGVVLIGALAEIMSKALAVGLQGSRAPPAVAAILVAAISACPEILTAMRAALANRMQSVVNIALGASLATVILTVPAMESIALASGQPTDMAMTPVQSVMVVITLIAAAINLNDGQSNAIEGMTHFVLFATFLMLSALSL